MVSQYFKSGALGQLEIGSHGRARTQQDKQPYQHCSSAHFRAFGSFIGNQTRS